MGNNSSNDVASLGKGETDEGTLPFKAQAEGSSDQKQSKSKAKKALQENLRQTYRKQMQVFSALTGSSPQKRLAKLDRGGTKKFENDDDILLDYGYVGFEVDIGEDEAVVEWLYPWHPKALKSSTNEALSKISELRTDTEATKEHIEKESKVDIDRDDLDNATATKADAKWLNEWIQNFFNVYSEWDPDLEDAVGENPTGRGLPVPLLKMINKLWEVSCLGELKFEISCCQHHQIEKILEILVIAVRSRYNRRMLMGFGLCRSLLEHVKKYNETYYEDLEQRNTEVSQCSLDPFLCIRNISLILKCITHTSWRTSNFYKNKVTYTHAEITWPIYIRWLFSLLKFTWHRFVSQPSLSALMTASALIDALGAVIAAGPVEASEWLINNQGDEVIINQLQHFPSHIPLDRMSQAWTVHCGLCIDLLRVCDNLELLRQGDFRYMDIIVTTLRSFTFNELLNSHSDMSNISQKEIIPAVEPCFKNGLKMHLNDILPTLDWSKLGLSMMPPLLCQNIRSSYRDDRHCCCQILVSLSFALDDYESLRLFLEKLKPNEINPLLCLHLVNMLININTRNLLKFVDSEEQKSMVYKLLRERLDTSRPLSPGNMEDIRFELECLIAKVAMEHLFTLKELAIELKSALENKDEISVILVCNALVDREERGNESQSGGIKYLLQTLLAGFSVRTVFLSASGYSVKIQKCLISLILWYMEDSLSSDSFTSDLPEVTLNTEIYGIAQIMLKISENNPEYELFDVACFLSTRLVDSSRMSHLRFNSDPWSWFIGLVNDSLKNYKGDETETNITWIVKWIERCSIETLCLAFEDYSLLKLLQVYYLPSLLKPTIEIVATASARSNRVRQHFRSMEVYETLTKCVLDELSYYDNLHATFTDENLAQVEQKLTRLKLQEYRLFTLLLSMSFNTLITYCLKEDKIIFQNPKVDYMNGTYRHRENLFMYRGKFGRRNSFMVADHTSVKTIYDVNMLCILFKVVSGRKQNVIFRVLDFLLPQFGIKSDHSDSDSDSDMPYTSRLNEELCRLHVKVNCTTCVTALPLLFSLIDEECKEENGEVTGLSVKEKCMIIDIISSIGRSKLELGYLRRLLRLINVDNAIGKGHNDFSEVTISKSEGSNEIVRRVVLGLISMTNADIDECENNGFLYFDGNNSGLQVTNTGHNADSGRCNNIKWNSGDKIGFSFSTWIRNLGLARQEQCLMSLKSKNGDESIIVKIELNGELSVEVKSNGAIATISTGHLLVPYQWHNVGVVFLRKASVSSSGVRFNLNKAIQLIGNDAGNYILVFVNGIVISRERSNDFPLPDFSNNDISSWTIARDEAGEIPYIGQMGTTLFWRKAIDLSLIKFLFSSGMSMGIGKDSNRRRFGGHKDYGSAEKRTIGKKMNQLLNDGDVIFRLDVKALDHKTSRFRFFSVNLSEYDYSGGQENQKKQPSVQPWAEGSFIYGQFVGALESMETLGWIRMVLPIVALSRPSRHMRAQNSDDEAPQTMYLHVLGLELMGNMIMHIGMNDRRLANCEIDVFQALSYVLKNIHPSLIDADTVHNTIALARKCFKPVDHSHLFQVVLQNVLLDFYIWSRSKKANVIIQVIVQTLQHCACSTLRSVYSSAEIVELLLSITSEGDSQEQKHRTHMTTKLEADAIEDKKGKNLSIRNRIRNLHQSSRNIWLSSRKPVVSVMPHVLFNLLDALVSEQIDQNDLRQLGILVTLANVDDQNILTDALRILQGLSLKNIDILAGELSSIVKSYSKKATPTSGSSSNTQAPIDFSSGSFIPFNRSQSASTFASTVHEREEFSKVSLPQLFFQYESEHPGDSPIKAGREDKAFPKSKSEADDNNSSSGSSVGQISRTETESSLSLMSDFTHGASALDIYKNKYSTLFQVLAVLLTSRLPSVVSRCLRFAGKVLSGEENSSLPHTSLMRSFWNVAAGIISCSFSECEDWTQATAVSLAQACFYPLTHCDLGSEKIYSPEVINVICAIASNMPCGLAKEKIMFKLVKLLRKDTYNCKKVLGIKNWQLVLAKTLTGSCADLKCKCIENVVSCFDALHLHDIISRSAHYASRPDLKKRSRIRKAALSKSMILSRKDPLLMSLIPTFLRRLIGLVEQRVVQMKKEEQLTVGLECIQLVSGSMDTYFSQCLSDSNQFLCVEVYLSLLRVAKVSPVEGDHHQRCSCRCCSVKQDLVPLVSRLLLGLIVNAFVPQTSSEDNNLDTGDTKKKINYKSETSHSKDDAHRRALKYLVEMHREQRFEEGSLFFPLACLVQCLMYTKNCVDLPFVRRVREVVSVWCTLHGESGFRQVSSGFGHGENSKQNWMFRVSLPPKDGRGVIPSAAWDENVLTGIGMPTALLNRKEDWQYAAASFIVFEKFIAFENKEEQIETSGRSLKEIHEDVTSDISKNVSSLSLDDDVSNKKRYNDDNQHQRQSSSVFSFDSFESFLNQQGAIENLTGLGGRLWMRALDSTCVSIVNTMIEQGSSLRLYRRKKDLQAETCFNRIIYQMTRNRSPWEHLYEHGADNGSLKPKQNWKISKLETFTERLHVKLTLNVGETASCQLTRHNNMDSSKLQVGENEKTKQTKENVLEGEEEEVFLSQSSGNDRESEIFLSECEYITPLNVITGIVRISDTEISFEVLKGEGPNISNDCAVAFNSPDASAMKAAAKLRAGSLNMIQKVFSRPKAGALIRNTDAYEPYIVWPVRSIRKVECRRYRFQWNAFELFVGETHRTTYMLNLPSFDICKQAAKIIGKLINTPGSTFLPKGSDLVRRLEPITDAWVERKISNLQYLMILNTIAGRTYNDLAQYPIMPWILADYESDQLDLSNPATFRDFHYPIGAQTQKSREALGRKYEETKRQAEELLTMPDAAIEMKVLQGPPWHFGSHYLSRATVLWYLVRLEPYTTLHVKLQDGKFDHADRQFSSIADAFNLIAKPTGIELIPEFYGCGEFLRVDHGVDLGCRQDGRAVGDVELPPWAGDSPEQFIYMHRLALESEYVSCQIHKWIDLIFGWRQRGPAAVEACNMYFHLMYEGAVDLNQLEESQPDLHRSVLRMTQEYGQIPPQLFDSPHRCRKENLKYGYFTTGAKRIGKDVQVLDTRISENKNRTLKKNAFRLIVSNKKGKFLATVDRNNRFRIHYMEVTEYDQGSIAENNSNAPTSSVSSSNPLMLRTPRKVDVGILGVELHPDLPWAGEHLFASWQTTIFSCGYWDSSIRAQQISQEKHDDIFVEHTGVVTCIAIDEKGKFLVSGSMDCTVLVWYIQGGGHSTLHKLLLKHRLSGHDSGITCVAASSEVDLVVSGSFDGTCNIYNMEGGDLLHTIPYPDTEFEVSPRLNYPTWIKISFPSNYICVFYPGENMLVSLTVNAKMVSNVRYPEKLCHPGSFTFGKNGRTIFAGCENGKVVAFDIHSLQTIENLQVEIPVQEPVTNLDFLHPGSSANSLLIVGTERGKVFYTSFYFQA